MDAAAVGADELAKWPLFEGESAETIAWIASLMTAREYAPGDFVVREGQTSAEFMVVLSGEVHFKRSNMDDILIAAEGEAAGVFPFSRMKTWGGSGWAAMPTRLGVMPSSQLREVVYRAPLLAQRLVAQMTDRTREFTRMEERANRLLALGKLSAGLAHELNNPASAAVRSSVRLREVLTERRKHALALRGEPLPEAARDLMTTFGQLITDCAHAPRMLDALERSDRESEMWDWLESVGAPVELSAGLVEAGLRPEELSAMAPLVSKEAMALGLRILVADHEILCLSQELEEASRRISDLVQSVKTYTYMDQSAVGAVRIEDGIEATLRMFQHQLKQDVEVVRNYAENLPNIVANGSALNQVWTNLIDNALDAMDSLPAGSRRRLCIRTCSEAIGILVEFTDSGPGIPPEVRNRMFEPFYTTKPVGQGSGLGLDIVQRVIRNHKGSIRVDSEPGRTSFQVRLPFTSAS